MHPQPAYSPPQRDPVTDYREARFGRSAAGFPLTWTGRPIRTLEAWLELSEWDRAGSTGKVWNGITQAWEQAEWAEIPGY